MAHRGHDRDPSIQQVLLFGSLARGEGGARSDADIAVVLSHAAQRRIDRIPPLLQAFEAAPLPLDIVAWTADEVHRAESERDPWWCRIRAEAIRLFP